jgi:hypothetical protein
MLTENGLLFVSRLLCLPRGLAILFALSILENVGPATALHHLKHPAMHTVNRRDSDIPLHVTNQCSEDIYPAILTQSGTGPRAAGFLLTPGNSTKLTVSADWRGRVWGRTNCTFDDNGHVPASSQGRSPCSSGDCGQFVECQGAVSSPPNCYSLSSHLQGQSTCNTGGVYHVIRIATKLL